MLEGLVLSSNRPGSVKNTKPDLTVALAGNANVGKSAVFNQLTGVDQIVGNWPGKTVERAEGLLAHEGRKIKIIDLPGIYSFTTYSMEELVTRDYIALEKPDIVVNVVDATALERNLFLTIQLLELGAPLIIVLNQIDLMEKRGISIDSGKLAEHLSSPVIPAVAIKGKGIAELMEAIAHPGALGKEVPDIRFGLEIEQRIDQLIVFLKSVKTDYPVRWLAIKLLERDERIMELVGKTDPGIARLANDLASEIERIHGEPISVVISAERYKIADEIARIVQKIRTDEESFSDRLDRIALHPVFGYLAVAIVIGGLLVWTFIIGAWMSGVLSDLLSPFGAFEPKVFGSFAGVLWKGAFAGFIAGLTLVIPYVLPFYIILAFIENSGYLTRISFLLDRGMHKLGLHGKAIIPMVLGYGCNVPACFSCRIMETPKQKLLAAFLVTLIPCTARTVVIFGLAAKFAGIGWGIALYVFDLVLIMILGRVAFKAIPGESVGLIMEMPSYHLPSLNVVLKQTWARTKSLLWVVFPAYIIGSAALEAVYSAGWLSSFDALLRPVTVGWLGLPEAAGILLLFGIVRKEMTILMIAVIFQTTDFASILSPLQLVVLSLVTMIYIPCLSVILALAKEFGWQKALGIALFEVVFAIFLGGIAIRLLAPVF